jgi:biopolymer transport protein ExbB/biopolymer transport protein TolQ
MGFIAKMVCIILAVLSIYSLTLSGERWWRYRAAKKQSLQFALLTTQYLKQDRPQDAIAASKKFKSSHLAKVVSAGLLEFMVEEQNSPLSGYDVIEAARRAIERATLMTTADFKRGLGGLATIGATAPFIGLFGTVVGIINAFRGMAITGSGGLGAVRRYRGSVGNHGPRPLRRHSAVWLYNFFLNQAERWASSGELLVGVNDFFIKKHGGSDATVRRR